MSDESFDESENDADDRCKYRRAFRRGVLDVDECWKMGAFA